MKLNDSVFKIVLLVCIAAAFLRGLWVFDGGGSANHVGTIAAGLCFAGGLVSATLLYCFDPKKRTTPQVLPCRGSGAEPSA